MKRLLIALIFAIPSFSATSQDTTVNKQISAGYISEGNVPYIVGSYNVPGYNKIEIRYCPSDGAKLSNGKSIAGLSCVIADKMDYFGGSFIFDGDTTTILDIRAIPIGNSGRFEVVGKSFTMGFELSKGTILALENEYATFKTEGEGLWEIRKKKR